MSLRDLTNDTARDATDFATEMAVDSVGAKGDIAGSGAIVPRWSGPPGGVRKTAFRTDVRVRFVSRKNFG